MEGISVRIARKDDISRIAEIAIKAWWPVSRVSPWERTMGCIGGQNWEFWKREELKRFLEDSPDRCFVAECEGRIVGFVTFSLDCRRRIGEIGNNAVDPDYQRRGISIILYSKVLEKFRQENMEYARVTTGMDQDHAAARRAYEKVGFRQVFQSVTYGLKL